jgi:hypothetical protein
VRRAALSELLVEIGAHARAITAIDIHPVQVDLIAYIAHNGEVHHKHHCAQLHIGVYC